MKLIDMYTIADWASKKILESGADECSVSVESNTGREVEFRKGKVETMKSSETAGLSVAIYKENRYSVHSTSDFDKNRLEKFITKGVEMTQYLNEDNFRKLPERSLYKKIKDIDLKLIDKKDKTPDEKTILNRLKNIENIISGSDENIISVTTGFGNNEKRSVLVNSNGFSGDRETSSFSTGAEVTAKNIDQGLVEDYFYASSRIYKDLPDDEHISVKAQKNTLQKRGQKKIESGKYTTLIENRCVGTILNTLLSPLRGSLIYQKKSYLENRFNSAVASENLQIIDDPFIRGGFGSRLFDPEGISAEKRVIIEKGILKSYLIDSYYSRKLNIPPTSGTFSNIVILPGMKTPETMMREVGEGILITGIIGGNFNSTTGDFSFGIAGMKIENGIPVFAINEMNVTGNATDLWRSYMEASDDVYTFSRIRVPTLRFSSLGYSGL